MGTTTNPTTSVSTTLQIGSGPDQLALRISQDAWQGSAEYEILVDGWRWGGIQTATALRGSGLTDALTIRGDWGPGQHWVEVRFLNDAWGGSAAADRNLYIEGATYNGAALAGSRQSLMSAGGKGFGFVETSPNPISATIGSGPDSLVLKVSQDRWQGDAQYAVKVDGLQIGGVLTAQALHALGQSDTITVMGDWGAGAHRVEVAFLNDAWGGSAATDRNLYLDGATYNGQTVDGAARALLADWSPNSFGFTEPDTYQPPLDLTVGSGPDVLRLHLSQDAYRGSAQYTVKVDGQQIGGTFTASAAHGAAATDTLTLLGNWGPGDHEVEVTFLNDAWGGSAAADRNLYLDGATYNGQAVFGASLDLAGTGAKSFHFYEAPPQLKPEFSEAATWADEFNGTGLDRAKFPVLYGGGALYGNGAFRWDSSEVSVSGGSLHIGVARQVDGIWATGGLSTAPNQWNPGFEFTYGKVEIRAKMSQEVVGAGPVFLLWPADGGWPPEVDILETPKGDGMFTNHWVGPDGEDRYEPTLFEVDLAQWHVYGLEWTPDRLTMTLDGQVVRTLTENVPHEAMTIGLQGHVGAAQEEWYGGSPSASGVGRVDIAVDYVRYHDYIG